jgi:hypothetical protein
MYRLEREWDEAAIANEERARRRQRGFARSLKWLHAVALSLRSAVLPQSDLGKACTYLLRHWEPLTGHTRHGHTKLDTNLVENAIRPSCIGKKYGKMPVMESWPAARPDLALRIASPVQSWLGKYGELFRGQIPLIRRCSHNTSYAASEALIWRASFA